MSINEKDEQTAEYERQAKERDDKKRKGVSCIQRSGHNADR